MQEILNRATKVMHDYIAQTERMKQGEIVSPYEINVVGREMTAVHWDVSMELATKFSAKEKSYLARKIAQANHYEKGRWDEKLKSAKDAENKALILSSAELYTEVDRASEYEQLRLIQRSIEKAMDQNRSSLSLMKLHENEAQ